MSVVMMSQVYHVLKIHLLISCRLSYFQNDLTRKVHIVDHFFPYLKYISKGSTRNKLVGENRSIKKMLRFALGEPNVYNSKNRWHGTKCVRLQKVKRTACTNIFSNT